MLVFTFQVQNSNVSVVQDVLSIYYMNSEIISWVFFFTYYEKPLASSQSLFVGNYDMGFVCQCLVVPILEEFENLDSLNLLSKAKAATCV